MIEVVGMIGGGLVTLLAGWLVLRRKPEVGTNVPEVVTPEPTASEYPPVGPQPENVPAGHIWMHDGAFRLVMTTNDGRRARMMFEKGLPGTGETLELFHGPNCRGRK